MHQIKRLLTPQQIGLLERRLRQLRFRFVKKGVVNAYFYPGGGVDRRVHFKFVPHTIQQTVEVSVHIDLLTAAGHKLDTARRDYERLTEWLDLPAAVAFDLRGVFTPPNARK